MELDVEELGDFVLAKPIAWLLHKLLGVPIEDYDTIAEIEAALNDWWDSIPIIGDLDNVIGALKAAFDGDPLPGGNPLTDLFDAAKQAGDQIRDIVENINLGVGGSGGALPVSQVFTDISGMILDIINSTTQAVEAKAALAALLAAQQAAASGGRYDSDNFTRANSADLGSEWSPYRNGAGTLGITSNKAAWKSSGTSGATEYDRFLGTEYLTDYQSVSDTISGTWPIGSANTTLFARADTTTGIVNGQASPLNAVGVEYGSDSAIRLITVVAGVQVSRGTYGYLMQAGDTLELRAGTLTSVRQFQVLLNGTIIISWTDTGPVTMLGAGYRWSGLRVGIGGGVFGQAPMPAIANFAMADLPAGAGLTGVGWRLYRAATSTVAVAEGSVFPTLFDTAELGVGVTLGTLGTGEIVVPKSGWYQIKVGITVSSYAVPANATRTFTLGCYVGGALYERGLKHRWTSGSTAVAADDHTLSDSFIVYAQAGQTIRCALLAGFTLNIQGSPGGDMTFFKGALMSPPGS